MTGAMGGSFPDALGAGLQSANTASGMTMLVDYVVVYGTLGAVPGGLCVPPAAGGTQVGRR
jgi:hypothetical protein